MLREIKDQIQTASPRTKLEFNNLIKLCKSKGILELEGGGFNCVNPYDKETGTNTDRIKSCEQVVADGEYPNRQQCVEKCHLDNSKLMISKLTKSISELTDARDKMIAIEGLHKDGSQNSDDNDAEETAGDENDTEDDSDDNEQQEPSEEDHDNSDEESDEDSQKKQLSQTDLVEVGQKEAPVCKSTYFVRLIPVVRSQSDSGCVLL